MAIEKFFITKEGFEKMSAELRDLRHNVRPAVIKSIAEARAHGDLSENAEYDAAKDRQGMIEAKIADLESKVSRAEVIDVSKFTDKVVRFGATVTFVDEDSNRQITYRIVGDYEADTEKYIISMNAPLARAAMGKTVGDNIEVNTPGGTRYYEIINVEYICQ